ncbi:MAG: cytidylate kinase, partial [Methylocystaceae bacterium]|nr:cytidylate kinase [Methylocystaceae bacterium]
LEDVRKRDARDSERQTAPLKQAKDAILIDTTELDKEAVFSEALKIVEERRN